MATIKDLAEQYGLEDYEQLLGGYPNAEKFITGLKDAAVRAVPTTEQMRDPNFIIDTAGLGGAIKAYHGSPHLFDRFDMSKLGTGEGAQAYGHGLYFAENPMVADDYLREFKSNKNQDATIYETNLTWPDKNKEQLDPLNKKHFLDYKKDFSKQSKYVQDAIENAANKRNEDPLYKGPFISGHVRKTGEDLLNLYGEDYLLQEGIPGVRYLDEGSRGLGKKTHNLVLFSDEYPQIVKRAGSLDELQEKNLNKQLIEKYLSEGKLSPDDMAQYEQNALAMETPLLQRYNVANADAQGGTFLSRAIDRGYDPDDIYTTNSVDEWLSSIKKKEDVGNYGGMFDGIFLLNGSEGGSRGYDFDHQFIANPNKIANTRDKDLDFNKTMSFLKKEYGHELNDDELSRLYDLTAYDDDIWDGGENVLSKLNDEYNDLGRASWEAQNIRGKLAKDQGFDLIKMRDEEGTSYFAPHGSKIKSTLAAFDPLRKNSSSIMASGLLGGLGLKYANDDDQGYAEGGPVDKDSLQLNKPQRTPSHPDKSHIVKTMVDGKEKIIRFGEQGAETAGKPKEGESDRMTAKRESFKARHAKNIAKGPSSAAYWANKVKWAEGGEVDLSDNQQMKAIPQQPNLARLAELLQNAKSSGNQYSVPDWVPLLGGSGAGDMLLGNAPEEIENWSYGDMPMRVPEMSNVPQFKKGRAQSLADTAMLLAGPAESTARNAMAGNVGMIIKPKGGNWLDAFGRTPEKSASQFSRSVDPELAGYARAGMHLMPHEYNETVPVMAVNDWLQQKLGKYIKNEMGTPEDPVRRIAEEWPAKRDVLISQQQSKIPNLQELAAKYEDMGLPPEVIASRMANANRDALTIQDKISELEGYNPLHYTPKDPREFDIDDVMAKREAADYPAEGIAKTNLGKLWEHYADENITPIRVKSISDMNEEKNPWLKKLDKEDQVYFPDTMVGTGFDKLADELRKATRPDTDLPDFLRIDPDKLSRVSMPQAVEHVAKINAWRDAERLKEGRNTATVMHKEYPDQGLSWMQMRMPENQDKEALKAALKFEGDTMGHCVGQYCDEVGGGDSNIYSLRDRRGEPHVTIETQKTIPNVAKFFEDNRHIIDSPEFQDTFKDMAYLNKDNYDDVSQLFRALKVPHTPAEMQEGIVQIKGKQNAAPNAKYLPAVHDFVRSKDWSSVGDFHNTGLNDLRKDEQYMHPDLYKMATDKYGRFATDDEMDALRDEFYIKNEAGNKFADGGLVGGSVDAQDDEGYADKASSYLDDLAQLKEAYPNANKFMSALKDAAYRSVPTTEQMMDPEFILENAGFGGLSTKLLKPMKASEAYGRIEGQNLNALETDRSKVGKGFLGGVGYTGLQHTSPPHAEVDSTWGVQTPSKAATIINGTVKPGQPDPVFTTFIGSPDQHRSNNLAFDLVHKTWRKALKDSDLLTPELIERMNERLATHKDYVDRKTGKPIFPADINVLSKNLKDYATTFDRRAALAEVLGGKGVGGKKGQIFDYDKVIRDTTDPALLDVPTGALGNRLFTLNGGILTDRYDLNPAFPTILQGKDFGLIYEPVPRELVFKDFVNDIRQKTGRDPGYMHWTRGYPPSQLITEDLLTEMQKAGYAKGGEVKALHDKYAEGGAVNTTPISYGFEYDQLANSLGLNNINYGGLNSGNTKTTTDTPKTTDTTPITSGLSALTDTPIEKVSTIEPKSKGLYYDAEYNPTATLVPTGRGGSRNNPGFTDAVDRYQRDKDGVWHDYAIEGVSKWDLGSFTPLTSRQGLEAMIATKQQAADDALAIQRAMVVHNAIPFNTFHQSWNDTMANPLDDPNNPASLAQQEVLKYKKELADLGPYTPYTPQQYAKGGNVKDLHNKYEESDYGYGNRPDKTKKGLGYFGELERPDGTGVMTEYSIGVPIHGEEMDVPTLIPTLTPDEIRLILHMQDGDDMPRSIVHKAIDHAHQRLSEGKSIFATEEDLYAHGGIVDVLHNDAIEQIMKAFMDSMADDEEPSAPAVSIEITTQNTETPRRGKIPKSIAREAKHG